MEINKFSTSFIVKKLTENNLDEMLAICKKNTTFYTHCPPQPTKKSLLKDLYALPPNKTLDDKFFIGFYCKNNLVAICDLILGYPNATTAFVGFFMMDINLQGKGIGSRIFQEMCQYLKQLSFKHIQLAYVKNNIQSKLFWEKNGFSPTGTEKIVSNYTQVVMQKKL